MGVPSLIDLFDEKNHAQLPGGILESFGRLFKNDLKLYVYPMLRLDDRRGASPSTTSRSSPSCSRCSTTWPGAAASSTSTTTSPSTCRSSAATCSSASPPATTSGSTWCRPPLRRRSSPGRSSATTRTRPDAPSGKGRAGPATSSSLQLYHRPRRPLCWSAKSGGDAAVRMRRLGLSASTAGPDKLPDTVKARGLRSARLIGLHSSRAHAVQLRLRLPQQRRPADQHQRPD